ncbi:hypothetical protein CANCADRAFT_87626 [Tortispora caseinolytica NRRL Y-17796]|uniref:PRKR-interacting protein 1 n=1 Tax=Tortispora caseinolytica NRRL Y-17796 TaxID=767744 RepID=A0A1E4TL74_9ASCO|nr:hypothetical protein CANCADRAFT_87626 [Tortispora caseinolytica NRRL Y-17796]
MTNKHTSQLAKTIDQLLSAPEKEIDLSALHSPRQTSLPTRQIVEDAIGAPRDMMKVVHGSTAAFNSGQFHIYKREKRRESERLRILEEVDAEKRKQTDFLARRAEKELEDQRRTEKNRKRRRKRNESKVAKRSASHTEPEVVSHARDASGIDSSVPDRGNTDRSNLVITEEF